MNLGGGQNEDHMTGRLLHDFQQRVERRNGEHVHLVDDIYLIGAGAGGIGGLIPQVADVVHAVVGGGVDLYHVQNGAVVDALADLADAAGIRAGFVLAVYCLGKNLGAGGLAGAPGTGEQIGMAHTAGGDLVFQGRHDALLAHHVLEGAGPPFAVKRPIHPAVPSFLPVQKTDRPASANAPAFALLGIRMQATCGAQGRPLNAARFPA